LSCCRQSEGCIRNRVASGCRNSDGIRQCECDGLWQRLPPIPTPPREDAPVPGDDRSGRRNVLDFSLSLVAYSDELPVSRCTAHTLHMKIGGLNNAALWETSPQPFPCRRAEARNTPSGRNCTPFRRSRKLQAGATERSGGDGRTHQVHSHLAPLTPISVGKPLMQVALLILFKKIS
jgi:hypothetical protein